MGCTVPALSASHHRVIGGLQVRVADGTTMIHCASLADRLAVLDALMGAEVNRC